jgi:hypothetical protein
MARQHTELVTTGRKRGGNRVATEPGTGRISINLS